MEPKDKESRSALIAKLAKKTSLDSPTSPANKEVRSACSNRLSSLGRDFDSQEDSLNYTFNHPETVRQTFTEVYVK